LNDLYLYFSSINGIRTLETVDRLTPTTVHGFSVVEDCAVETLTLTSNRRAVWISLRGSSTLELWSVDTATCTMLFDLTADASSSIRLVLTVSESVSEWYITEDRR